MFVNLTPHIIRIKGTNLVTQREHVCEIPPSGDVATCLTRISNAQAYRLDQFEYGVISRSLGKVLLSNGQPFPAPELGKVFIVSSMVQDAMPRADVLAPDTGPTAIRDERGNVWAVTRLIGPA